MKKSILAALCLALALATPCLGAGYTVSVTQIVEHPSLDAMRQGFMDHFKEQKIEATYNVHIAQGNPATNTQIASQIAGEKPNLILAITTPSAQAVAQKIKDIPVVISGVTDPVGAGLVKSLEAPGGNLTGMTDMIPVERQVGLIRQFQPNLKKLGILYNAGEANSVVTANMAKDVCAKLGIEMVEGTAANSGAVYQAAKSLVGKVEAIYIQTDNTVVSALESVIKVATENKIPVYSGDTDSVVRGTVAALAIDYYRMGRQTGAMAERILKGEAKPATMPVETLKDLQLFVNKKAAAAMGATIPADVLAKADKVVE